MPQTHHSFNTTESLLRKRYGWVVFAQAAIFVIIMITAVVVGKRYRFDVSWGDYLLFAILYMAYELAILKIITIANGRIAIKGANPFRPFINATFDDIADIRLKSGRTVTEVIINLKNGSIINRDVHLTKKELSSLINCLQGAGISVSNTPYKALKQRVTTS